MTGGTESLRIDDAARASQAVFRAVMSAMARPGSLQQFPGLARPDVSTCAPLSRAMAATALALFDYETPVYLDPPLAAAAQVAAWLRFHTAAPVVHDPSHAAFALIADPIRLAAFDTFALGTPEYPDRSTTLIIEVETFASGPRHVLCGPGIRHRQGFSAAPLPPDLVDRLTANRALFPCGVDLILVAQDALAALPRTVRIAAAAED